MKVGMDPTQVKYNLQRIMQEPAFREKIDKAEQIVNQQGIFRLLN